ncbi:acyl-CoA N-acyltransferase [Triangularia setosa]|uniref:Acyl-CoA N-acyltransferase n=1 Tax=Triangularia setosa TaxID=2587417 RepID=A0AAN6W867_9PEZI|nr:acyl-CoA N-acyltransferase [Podospora setosa]
MTSVHHHLRLATEADLLAMADVLNAASRQDPIYPYRFPDRHLYPSEFALLCRQKCSEYLASSTVVVCEMPSATQTGAMRVVAFAVWDTPASYHRVQARTGRLEPLPSQRPSSLGVPITIGHKDRMDAFKSACVEYKASFFDAKYKRGHVMLRILLCHPDYQRQGAGRALTEWGIQEARRLGLYTTVFASPMGLRLYTKLGFTEIGRFRVEVEGDEEHLEIPALVLSPTARMWEAGRKGSCGMVTGTAGAYNGASSTVCA